MRSVIEALGGLCDPHAPDELIAALEPRVTEIFKGREAVQGALAKIDACLARRQAADFATALPR